MLRLHPSIVAAAAGAALLCATGLAGAQTITIAQQGYPNRDQPLRPQNLNPQGVSFKDCKSDMTLTFPMVVSAFDGSENLQVWASKTSNCTALTDRGSGGIPVCWKLDGGFTAKPYLTTTSIQIPLRVQDILGPQNDSPPPLTPTTHGVEACTTQSSYQAVPIYIDFVPTDASNNPVGTAYQYTLNVDLVGPAPPTGVGETVGHTLFNLTWTPNTDTDTLGYDIFIDPIRGQEGVDAGAVSADSGAVQVCPGSSSGGSGSSSGATGEASTGDDGSALGAGDGGSTGTPDATTSDAGCYYVSTGGPPASTNGYACGDSILASGIVQDAATTSGGPVYDEAGNLIDDGGTTSTGFGGISTIPDGNRVGSDPTIADKSLNNYTITGLIDGINYTVVIAAVDGYGNAGPPSSEVCDKPAPVQDFWQIYEQDGGRAGGFCSLQSVGLGGTSLAGVASFIGLAGIVRRLRRRSR